MGVLRLLDRFSFFLGVLAIATVSVAQEARTDPQRLQHNEIEAEAKRVPEDQPRSLEVQKGTRAWKIQNAMSAAPQAIAKTATVVDFPAEGAVMPVLRSGTNGWTCLPDEPGTPANDPMCMDRMAIEWAKAKLSQQEPRISSVGIGYMLQGGGSASHTDPFAKKPAPGQKWMKEPPHLMIFPASGTKLDLGVYGTGMHSGGPRIVWAGTPYEHLVVPVK